MATESKNNYWILIRKEDESEIRKFLNDMKVFIKTENEIYANILRVDFECGEKEWALCQVLQER